MRQIHMLHLGVGKVGKELLQQICNVEELLRKRFAVQFLYHGLFTSKNGLINTNGFSADTALQMIKANKGSVSYEVEQLIQEIPMPFLLIDTTASDATVPYIVGTLRRGGFVVLSNKKPLAGTQEQFDTLHKLSQQRLLYETVVGAGLPVIRTIKDMQDSGDDIVEIQGCLSGTLSFILSELDGGSKFSEVITDAKSKGFTEPDPRDDLSGRDVARKTLILARIIGQKMELENIQCMSLYPKNLESLNTNEFLAQIRSVDLFYKTRVEKAKRKNKVLRYVAKVSKKVCTVGLQEVDISSDIGSLKGPENLIAIRTKRYSPSPLVIKGPGAGIEVTAAGVFADMLEVVKRVEGILI